MPIEINWILTTAVSTVNSTSATTKPVRIILIANIRVTILSYKNLKRNKAESRPKKNITNCPTFCSHYLLSQDWTFWGVGSLIKRTIMVCCYLAFHGEKWQGKPETLYINYLQSRHLVAPQIIKNLSDDTFFCSRQFSSIFTLVACS